LINGPLVNGGAPDHRVIAPGLPTNSMLLTRISTRGPGQMPPLASSLLDACEPDATKPYGYDAVELEIHPDPIWTPTVSFHEVKPARFDVRPARPMVMQEREVRLYRSAHFVRQGSLQSP
jgi:hypothetical protein